MPLSTKLRDLRLRKGESLQQVADAIGASKTHVWELEKGRVENPSLDMLKRLADHFKVTIRSIVGEDVDQSEDENLIRMFRQAGDLDPDEREILDDMLQSLLKRRRKGES